MLGLILIALGTLVSEDLTCIAAGVLVAQGKHSLAEATVACIVGIFVGDMMLFGLGRLANVRWVERFVSISKMERAAAWLRKRGPWVVLLSRFAPGMRLPTYVASGFLRMNAWRFAAYFLAASLVWTPLLVGLSAYASAYLGSVRLALSLIAAGVVITRVKLPRRIHGFLQRKVRWEFWPAWAAYLPLVPYLVYLAVKHHSLTVFTAANPGIPGGGFTGESKTEILDQLDSSVVARYEIIPSNLGEYARIARALQFAGNQYPVVLKPDVGERGNGVAVIRSEQELSAYLHDAKGDTIVQEYLPGSEYGVFYYRVPGEVRGHILSITEKRFPCVIGDGVRTLRQLILDDERAVCMASTYIARSNRPVTDVPAAGERVQLVELGSHCKGAMFLDGRHLLTPELEDAVNRIGLSFPEFSIGRFDVRAPSQEHFQRGMFRVLELNGVTAEPAHIYDPAVSLREAYATLAMQWRLSFELGVMQRTRGVQPTTLRQLIQLIRSRPRPSERSLMATSIQPVRDPAAQGRSAQDAPKVTLPAR